MVNKYPVVTMLAQMIVVFGLVLFAVTMGLVFGLKSNTVGASAVTVDPTTGEANAVVENADVVIDESNRQEMAKKYCPDSSDSNSMNGVVLPNGYWCIGKDFVTNSKYKRTNDYSDPSASVVGWLYEHTKGKSIIELGAGCATYGQGLIAKAREQSETPGRYIGYEGALNAPERFPDLMKWADLSKPLKGADVADWAISFEVGEHIPKEFEDVFLDNIANHAKEGVLMSWAIVGQPGRGHINCQNPDWVVKKMQARGWKWDEEETKKLRALPQSNETNYFTKNLLLFRK